MKTIFTQTKTINESYKIGAAWITALINYESLPVIQSPATEYIDATPEGKELPFEIGSKIKVEGKATIIQNKNKATRYDKNWIVEITKNPKDIAKFSVGSKASLEAEINGAKILKERKKSKSFKIK